MRLKPNAYTFNGHAHSENKSENPWLHIWSFDVTTLSQSYNKIYWTNYLTLTLQQLAPFPDPRARTLAYTVSMAMHVQRIDLKNPCLHT